MRGFFLGRLIGVGLIFAIAGLYSIYKYVDHSINYVSTSARVDAVDSVCTGRLKTGGEDSFPCEQYDLLRHAKKHVRKVTTITVAFISPVDDTQHDTKLVSADNVRVGDMIPIYASKTNAEAVDRQ